MGTIMDVECVLLTGGQSRRMGVDKASVLIEGVRADVTLCRRLSWAGYGVTVLGKTPVCGYPFVADIGGFGGPAVALARYAPEMPYVFVLACDVFRFDPAFVDLSRRSIGGHRAAAPVADECAQPLCALYRSDAFSDLREAVARRELRLRRWLAGLSVREITSDELVQAGLDPACVRGANTPEELLELGFEPRKS